MPAFQQYANAMALEWFFPVLYRIWKWVAFLLSCALFLDTLSIFSSGMYCLVFQFNCEYCDSRYIAVR